MKSMADKLASLTKKIEESNKKEETTEFEQAKQDVKDKAGPDTIFIRQDHLLRPY